MAPAAGPQRSARRPCRRPDVTAATRPRSGCAVRAGRPPSIGATSAWRAAPRPRHNGRTWARRGAKRTIRSPVPLIKMRSSGAVRREAWGHAVRREAKGHAVRREAWGHRRSTPCHRNASGGGRGFERRDGYVFLWMSPIIWSPPVPSNTSSVSVWPIDAAVCSAVRPSRSCRLGSHDAPSSSVAIRGSSLHAA